MLNNLAAIGLCVIFVATLCYVVGMAAFGPRRLRAMAESILNPQSLANTEANAQRLRDEPVASGKFIIDFKANKDAPIYQLGKTTVGELEDGTGLRHTGIIEITCEPETQGTIILYNSEESTDTWGFNVHLVIVNQTDEATSYRNCTIVAISNIDHIMVPGGAYTGMGWDKLRQAYGEDFVQDDRLVLDGTGDEKFGDVYDLQENTMRGHIAFESVDRNDDLDYVDYDIRQHELTPEEYLELF